MKYYEKRKFLNIKVTTVNLRGNILKKSSGGYEEKSVNINLL